MRKPEWKLGKALSAATALYLLCSIFGCALYLVMPPFLSSVGARFHAYLLFTAAVDQSHSVLPMVWTVLAHLYMICQVIFGILAIQRGWLRIYTLLTVGEILMTVIYLAFCWTTDYSYASGIVLNMAYCIWIFRKSLAKKTVAKKH